MTSKAQLIFTFCLSLSVHRRPVATSYGPFTIRYERASSVWQSRVVAVVPNQHQCRPRPLNTPTLVSRSLQALVAVRRLVDDQSLLSRTLTTVAVESWPRRHHYGQNLACAIQWTSRRRWAPQLAVSRRMANCGGEATHLLTSIGQTSLSTEVKWLLALSRRSQVTAAVHGSSTQAMTQPTTRHKTFTVTRSDRPSGSQGRRTMVGHCHHSRQHPAKTLTQRESGLPPSRAASRDNGSRSEYHRVRILKQKTPTVNNATPKCYLIRSFYHFEMSIRLKPSYTQFQHSGLTSIASALQSPTCKICPIYCHVPLLACTLPYCHVPLLAYVACHTATCCHQHVESVPLLFAVTDRCRLLHCSVLFLANVIYCTAMCYMQLKPTVVCCITTYCHCYMFLMSSRVECWTTICCHWHI